MRRVNTSVEELEQVVGTRRPTMLLKQVDQLDADTRTVVGEASLAGLGYRDSGGQPYTTFVGGGAGFAVAETPTRVRLRVATGLPRAAIGTGASLVFFVSGLGETLRVNGTVAGHADDALELDVEEAFVHCARCVLRSRLWDPAEPSNHHHASGDLEESSIASFLSTSPFIVLTTWDADGRSDTSPRGDDPGFLRSLDAGTLVIPDRRGNTRTDTFHNLVQCDEISAVALVPGSEDVLRMRGRGYVTDDSELLGTMAVPGSDRLPKAALVINVDNAQIEHCPGLRDADLWSVDARPDTSHVPDLMELSLRHIVATRSRGVLATLSKVAARALALAPRVLRRGVDHGYRKELADEGYTDRS